VIERMIHITVRNGSIDTVDGIPEHYAIEVFDYDIDKFNESELSEDDDRRVCRILEFRSEQ
jgi:hypothetical protein